MSQENVDTVRSIYDGWSRGDTCIDRFGENMVMLESESLPGAVSAHGIEAVRRYIQSFAKYWDEIRFEPSEYIAAGDQVVVVADLIGRGKSSGVPVEHTWAYVWTVQGGKAVRMEGFADRAAALEAAGVSE